jgi:hypothetical protein
MIRKCAVKGCDRPAIVGGIITGTKDVLLELCEYHRSQFRPVAQQEAQ